MKSLILFVLALTIVTQNSEGSDLSMSTFRADVTPPIGAALCNGNRPPVKSVQDPLSARGVVIFPEGDAPIVLCAVDWVGIGNRSYTEYRKKLADAVGTSIDRVAVHALHQHDSPGCDFSVERILSAHDLSGAMFDADFAYTAMERTARAAKDSINRKVPLTHIGAGQATVERVASNRRLIGEDGKVAHVRYTACRDPEVRAWPEGTIDPDVRVVSFWNEEAPIAVLSYYATHPQSYYGQGNVSADFVGMARSIRAGAIPGAEVIHFTGAAGNIGAGKYNDGSPENRPELAWRLADGMKRAWEATDKQPIGSEDIEWNPLEVTLPLREEIVDSEEWEVLSSTEEKKIARVRAAREIAFRNRTREGHATFLSCLRIGPVQILNMPGELFVEYQLAAQEMSPNSTVCVAAYGEYAPGYIGTAEAYDQGGYETQLHTSRVSPKVEGVLMEAMGELLR